METSTYHISTMPLFAFVRDIPASEPRWETFSVRSLPGYFTDGVRVLHTELDKLADFSKQRHAQDDRNLWFMLESLIQARHLIDETRVPESHRRPGNEE